ncbi:MAG: GNAT family N-acetyltransferase [Paenibacillus sp.]|nr:MULTISPECIES: GNAT family N-acetyltransferase [unclassified Paenibacillus]MDU4696314.1 GNAT family N-acetyltransferase [Paenibacillus sp.]
MRECSLKIAHKGNVFGIFVRPELRGQGLGKLLLLKQVKKEKN